MTPESAANRPFNTALFVAWVAGGVCLLIASWVLFEDYFSHYFTESAFEYINPTPEIRARRMYYESINYLLAIGPVYGAAGMGVFRREGCVAGMWAAAFAVGPLLIQGAHGLGRL